MAQWSVRPGGDGDLDAVWELNQAEVPAVGDVTRDELTSLVARSSSFLVAEPGPVAFVIAFGPGSDYASPNYRFFADRHADFVYVDRIVVGPVARGTGLGRTLYTHLLDRASAPVLCAEVNVRPRNDGSLVFHDRMGFTAVGEQDTYGGAFRVRLLERTIP